MIFAFVHLSILKKKKYLQTSSSIVLHLSMSRKGIKLRCFIYFYIFALDLTISTCVFYWFIVCVYIGNTIIAWVIIVIRRFKTVNRLLCVEQHGSVNLFGTFLGSINLRTPVQNAGGVVLHNHSVWARRTIVARKGGPISGRGLWRVGRPSCKGLEHVQRRNESKGLCRQVEL